MADVNIVYIGLRCSILVAKIPEGIDCSGKFGRWPDDRKVDLLIAYPGYGKAGSAVLKKARLAHTPILHAESHDE
jgi:hypothetical protein